MTVEGKTQHEATEHNRDDAQSDNRHSDFSAAPVTTVEPATPMVREVTRRG